MKAILFAILVPVLIFAVMFLPIGRQSARADEPEIKAEAKVTEESALKTKEERLRDLRLAKAEITLKQMKVSMDEKKADYNSMTSLFEKGLVSIQEMNDAKKDMEDATLAYEQAKLDLQMSELESLKAAWHIKIVEAKVIDRGDSKYMEITLENTSEPVELERTQKMVEAKIIDPVETKVNPEINDIYVSIKEGESIISKPYEGHIPSLKLGKPATLVFELIKDVTDVVVSMRYEDQEDKRNIHLKKIEPYVSVVRAIKYKTGEDRRMIYVVFRNGAVDKEGEHVAGGKTTAKPDHGKDAPEAVNRPAADTDSSERKEVEEVEDVLNDINNIYVSIKDEQNNIVGIPYEIRIPILKYNEQRGYKFELQKDINSVVISMNYLKKENNKTVYLEPDTRHISIERASVRNLPSGKKEVTLELVNRSESGKMPFEEELKEISGSSAEVSREIRNVFVSLKHQGIVIARPYETVIERLEYDKPEKLTFELQHPEVDSVAVSLSYLDRNEERNVYLEKLSPPDEVTVSSVAFAQEGKLGYSVDYDLMLERLSETERIFKLRVIDLSEQFTYQFNDNQSGTRVTQIRFTHDQTKRSLSLKIFLPEEMDLSLLNKPMDFYAAVLSEEEDAGYTPGRLELDREGLDKIKSKVRLVLTPKGVPEFELIAQNLYFEIKKGEIVEMLVTLKNTGTRGLDDIRIVADLPSNNWNADIQPKLVSKLDREQEKEIKIVITPPLDVSVGDTEVRIRAECEVDNVKVEAPEKNVRIHVESKTNVTGTIILIGALILLVIVIAVLTIRLSRR